MFSAWQAFRLAVPIPPTPIAAMFSLRLGACAPSTRRGTTAAESAARAEVEANCLRDTVCRRVVGHGAAILVSPGSADKPCEGITGVRAAPLVHG